MPNFNTDRLKKLSIALIFHSILCVWSSSTVVAQQTAEDYAAPAMEPPVINTSPLPLYGNDRLDYGMTIGIERTPKGRIWACWVGGGDNDKAFFVLATSDNEGKTWSKPRVAIDPHDASLKEARRTIVGNLWTDPLGRLWLFFDQSVGFFDGRAGNWYTICENPDSDNPVWSAPVRMSYGCSLNKPVVLSNGDWMIVVSLWHREKIQMAQFKEGFHELDTFRMANMFVSTDQGKTWNRRGGVRFLVPDYNESHVIERKDGSLWLTTRTGKGLFESFSNDKGVTWSEPQPSLIKHWARHYIRRLQSGNLLLVKHGPKVDEATKGRSQLTAFLSDDDGKTWKGGLSLDERRGVSYPDGFQAPNGSIFISYDRNRDTDGYILMARFTEEDILKGKFSGKKSRARMLISEPGAIEALQPWQVKKQNQNAVSKN